MVPPSESTLVGSAIGGDELVDSTIIAKIKHLKLTGERLQTLSSHDAPLILSDSLAIPKVCYLLHTALEFFGQTLQKEYFE